MPSPAVAAKVALLNHVALLRADFEEHGCHPDWLPGNADWVRIRHLARAVLRLKGLEFYADDRHLTWREFARLEKAYRPGLDFAELLEPFVKAVESDDEPYATLQARHWAKTVDERQKIWVHRSKIAQVISWLIYDVRHCSSFRDDQKFPSYEKFCSIHRGELVVGEPWMWVMAGNLLSAEMGHEFKPPFFGPSTKSVLETEAGYKVFLAFHKKFQDWALRRNWRKGYGIPEASRQLAMLNNPSFEARLVKRRITSYTWAHYREKGGDMSGQVEHGQVPTMEGIEKSWRQQSDTMRKRIVRKSKVGTAQSGDQVTASDEGRISPGMLVKLSTASTPDSEHRNRDPKTDHSKWVVISHFSRAFNGLSELEEGS